MEWLVYVVTIWCMTRLSEEASVKCYQGSDDLECLINHADYQSIQRLVRGRSREPPVSAAADEPAGEPECLPGTTWISNCHKCHCLPNGVADCILISNCLGKVAEPIKCKPNTTFARDCNTCICLSNGLGLCTLESCQRSVKKKSDLPAGHDCAPQTFWKSRCNDCGCSPNGYAYCTEQACPDHMDEPLLSCAPDSMWKNECNTCWCTITGYALCTRMGCTLNVNYESAELKLSPATDSNLKTSKNETKAIVCVANRMFIMDCNTCWCNEDGTSYFCTRKVCVPEDIDEEPDKPEELRVIKKDCRPDEVFELDCNMCRCNPDGKSFSCTRRACAESTEELGKNGTLSRRIREKETPKACVPGVEFRLDCNKCLCNDEGQDFSCTRIDCTALNNNGGVASYSSGAPRVRRAAREVAAECAPGSVFDQQCNVCRCTADGKHAMCTLNRCSKPGESETTPASSDPGFRCNPGEQFKRGCNDCTCSADGKSIFCTLRLCDQDLAGGM